MEEKIIQFGEGNFLRGFIDWMVQEMNEKAGFNSSIVVVQPIRTGMIEKLSKQDWLYHVAVKGTKNKNLIKDIKLNNSISRGVDPYLEYENYIHLAEIPSFRFIISNTTEAGIAFNSDDTIDMQPPSSFPAKLTQFLFHRFAFFKGDINKGFIILPCELIENNAVELKNCIVKYCDLWQLPIEFKTWIENSNTFCNTLVDRIVPGYNKETALEIANQKNMVDNFCVDTELFYLWVIEGDQKIKKELPADKAGLNVIVVNDIKPYHTRKVRLLNGPHTLMTPVAYLSGIQYVREAVEHPVIGKFILNTINNEIIPTLTLPDNELKEFASEVLDRFKNPFINHSLASISLNSISKFKTRLLPGLLDYNRKFGKLPENIVFSLTALIIFYKGSFEGRSIHVQDDESTKSFFLSAWEEFNMDYKQLIHLILGNEKLWGTNLCSIYGMEELIHDYLLKIHSKGMTEAVTEILND